jgi:hypothetical protein
MYRWLVARLQHFLAYWLVPYFVVGVLVLLIVAVVTLSVLGLNKT